MVCYSILVVLGLLSVAIVNYKVDPAHLFSDGEYEKGIASLLLAGDNITVSTNYDERNMNKIYINGLNQPKEVIVFGSSRSMHLTSILFPGRSFFNNSVSAASIEDYLAIYDLYRRRNYVPSIVVLGLDPWILNKNNGATLWTSLKEEYLEMINILNLPAATCSSSQDIWAVKFKQLFSLRYFTESLTRLFSGKGGYSRVEDSNFADAGILNDGSRVMDFKSRNRTVEEVEASAIDWAGQAPVSNLGDFTELDRGLTDTLVKFIDYLQENGVKVVFYLPPFHPSTYHIIAESPKYGIILSAEQCFRDIAGSHGIQVLGGYNPADSRSTREEFYDSIHPKESSILKSFENIK